MKIFAWVASCVAACAFAQHPDCPKANAPMPTSPPGPPPRIMPPMFTPPATFPKSPEEWKAATPPSQVREMTPAEIGAEGAADIQKDVAQLQAGNWLRDVEEGHVSSLLFVEKRSRGEPLPADAAPMAADLQRTPLSAWRYVGHVPTGMPSRAERLYRASDGSLLSLQEWSYKADGGAIYRMPGMSNRKVGGHAATLTGMKGPSGCVKSILQWQDDRKDYRLELAGPLDVEAQRALLVQVAEAIAAQ